MRDRTNKRVPADQLASNLKIMDKIIQKYKPKKVMRDLSRPRELTEEQSSEVMDVGLEHIAKHLDNLSNGRLELEGIRAPQKKLYVMIIGNHSAGKSSFINWYIGEKLQQTRVSIETIEINLVMNGAFETELSGHNVMKQLPFMDELYDK